MIDINAYEKEIEKLDKILELVAELQPAEDKKNGISPEQRLELDLSHKKYMDEFTIALKIGLNKFREENNDNK